MTGGPCPRHPVLRRVVTASLAAGLSMVAACSSSAESPIAAPTTGTEPIAVTTAVPPSTGPTTSPTTATVAPATTTTMTSPPTSTPDSTAPATTTTATTAPLPTTTAAPEPTDDTVLVYAGGSGGGTWQRLGAWDGTTWVDLDDDATFDPGVIDRVSVASVDLPGAVAGVDATMSDYACVDAPLHVGIVPDVDLPESPLGWGYNGVAVRADWPLQPRPVSAVGLGADVYQTVGEELLAGRPGIDPADGDVVQVLRVDLDGDGTEEVLVSFRYLSAPDFGALGDFSIVYVRHVRAGGVEDEIVYEYLVPESPDFPAPGRGSVVAVADLNGDGRMEVAISGSYWETQVIEVFELRDGSLSRILTGGCGV